jgi:hypothetical protein
MRRTGVRTLRRGFQARDATLYIGVEDQVPQDRQGPLQSRWPLEVQLATLGPDSRNRQALAVGGITTGLVELGQQFTYPFSTSLFLSALDAKPTP